MTETCDIAVPEYGVDAREEGCILIVDDGSLGHQEFDYGLRCGEADCFHCVLPTIVIGSVGCEPGNGFPAFAFPRSNQGVLNAYVINRLGEPGMVLAAGSNR